MRFFGLFPLLQVVSALQFAWRSDWCLAVLEGFRNRAPLRLRPCEEENANQSFSWDPLTGHLVWDEHPSLCVDVLAGCASNGNQVQVWDCQAAPDANHVFELEASSIWWAGGGLPKKCLEVTNPEEPLLSYIQIWDCDPGRLGQNLVRLPAV